jgi:hypothetical protein
MVDERQMDELAAVERLQSGTQVVLDSADDVAKERRAVLAEAFASLTNAALSVLRLLRQAARSLRATAEVVHLNPLTALQRLGFIRLARQG